MGRNYVIEEELERKALTTVMIDLEGNYNKVMAESVLDTTGRISNVTYIAYNMLEPDKIYIDEVQVNTTTETFVPISLPTDVKLSQEASLHLNINNKFEAMSCYSVSSVS